MIDRMTDERLAEIEKDWTIVQESMTSSLAKRTQGELLQALKRERLEVHGWEMATMEERSITPDTEDALEIEYIEED
jgi:hypothetical protein